MSASFCEDDEGWHHSGPFQAHLDKNKGLPKFTGSPL